MRQYLSILGLAVALAPQQILFAQQDRVPRGILPGPEFEARQAGLWSIIKTGLQGPNRAAFWQNLESADLPGGANGIDLFEGTLISSTPADHPNEFMVAIGSSSTPEAKLQMREHLEKPIPDGSPVTFVGVATAYQSDPYLLTLEVETVNRLTVEDSDKKKGEAPKHDDK
ncbi:MAG: hypothetical protein ABSB35_23010 [Bryobacteraceae bacterium]